jgi:hypothetical protein
MVDYRIPITYVVSASAVTPQRGLEPLKLSTILLLTTDEALSSFEGSYIIARTLKGVTDIFGTETETAKQAQAIFAQQPNILANDGYLIVAPLTSTTEDETTVYENLDAAIARIANEIYFEGILTTKEATDEEYAAASTAVQAMQNRVLMLPRSSSSAFAGIFTTVQSNYNTKCLYYSYGTNPAQNARIFAAAYLSKALSVNYNGSNTTMTMNLKDLAGIQADTNISESVLQQCTNAGADCFPSIEGLPKVISNAQGGMYIDQILNQIWFVNTIQRNVFNVLATTRTKIAQTDANLEIITKTIRQACNQGVTNGYLAPGTWNSSDTFGNYEDFYRNIEEFGYYIYHQPVAEQSQTDRQARKAPVYQIAGKEAGAVHLANILIYIEA